MRPVLRLRATRGSRLFTDELEGAMRHLGGDIEAVRIDADLRAAPRFDHPLVHGPPIRPGSPATD
jgi:hypothetical protein